MSKKKNQHIFKELNVAGPNTLEVTFEDGSRYTIRHLGSRLQLRDTKPSTDRRTITMYDGSTYHANAVYSAAQEV